MYSIENPTLSKNMTKKKIKVNYDVFDILLNLYTVGERRMISLLKFTYKFRMNNKFKDWF